MYLHCPLADGARNVARQFIAFVKSRWRRELQAKQGRVGVFFLRNFAIKIVVRRYIGLYLCWLCNSQLVSQQSAHVFESKGGGRQSSRSACLKPINWASLSVSKTQALTWHNHPFSIDHQIWRTSKRKFYKNDVEFYNVVHFFQISLFLKPNIKIRILWYARMRRCLSRKLLSYCIYTCAVKMILSKSLYNDSCEG